MIYHSDFQVTPEMVCNGRLIKKKIPDQVLGHFNCSGLNLTTLEGCPRYIKGRFRTCYNKLTDLKGCPDIIDGEFDCSNNELTSLEYYPIDLRGEFDCTCNNLFSFKGCPEKMYYNFYGRDNDFKSLEYAPFMINSSLLIDHNFNIEKKFIETIYCKSTKPEEYWIDLLQYMINNKIELYNVLGWPKDFISNELIKTTQSINKFDL